MRDEEMSEVRIFNQDFMESEMDKISDLQIGKAGEYLVCADLILQGHIAFPSEQGLPYDVVLDCNSRLYRVQVKTTRKSKNIAQRKNPIPAYIFHIGINGSGKTRKTKYQRGQVDLFALVALDTKQIAYIPYFDCQTTMNFRVPSCRGTYHDEIGVSLKKQITDMRKQKIPCHEIATTLNMKLSNVHKYTSNTSLEQKGTNAGVYFDTFTLDRCLCLLK